MVLGGGIGRWGVNRVAELGGGGGTVVNSFIVCF